MPYIAHLILNVSDFHRSTTFYDQLFRHFEFRIRTVHDDDEVKIKAYDLPGCPIYLRWNRDEDKLGFVRNVGLDHLCIGVDTREELHQMHEIVQSLGVIITRAPRLYPDYWEHYYAFYFRDPDGIPLEVVCMAEQETESV